MKEYEQTVYRCEFCGFTSVNKESVEQCEQCHRELQASVLYVKYSPKIKYPTTLAMLDADGNKVTYRLDD